MFNYGLLARNPGGVNFHILRTLKRTLFSLLQEANYLVAVTRSGNDRVRKNFTRHSVRLWATYYYEKREEEEEEAFRGEFRCRLNNI